MEFENNMVDLTGEIIDDFEFSHICAGEKFYKSHVQIKRKSGIVDILPIIVSDRVCDMKTVYKGAVVDISGQFRSRNNSESDRVKVDLFVFVLKISMSTGLKNFNNIFLNGTFCKKPVYRETPLGKEIADVTVAINRNYGKSDYIPCIAWGRNARYINQFSVGTIVRLKGRIQSREYLKKLDDGTQETRTAYEVSVSRIEVVESEESEE